MWVSGPMKQSTNTKAENIANTWTGAWVIEIFFPVWVCTSFYTGPKIKPITEIVFKFNIFISETNPKPKCLGEVYCCITTFYVTSPESPIKEFHFSDAHQLDDRKLKNGGKSSCVSHLFVTVMTIGASMVRRETFQSVDHTLRWLMKRRKIMAYWPITAHRHWPAQTSKKQIRWFLSLSFWGGFFPFFCPSMNRKWTS